MKNPVLFSKNININYIMPGEDGRQSGGEATGRETWLRPRDGQPDGADCFGAGSAPTAPPT